MGWVAAYIYIASFLLALSFFGWVVGALERLNRSLQQVEAALRASEKEAHRRELKAIQQDRDQAVRDFKAKLEDL